MRKQNTNHEVEKSLFSDDDFSGLLIQGADELRQRLRMSDRSFTFMSRAHNLRGRPHFVYSVSDEVEQVAMALQLSEESVSGDLRDKPDDEVGERLLRNAFAVVEREQALHIRRLTEILVDLINFSQTNSNAYYDHYLLYRELAEHRARQDDFDRPKNDGLLYEEVARVRYLVGCGFRILLSSKEATATMWKKITADADHKADIIADDLLSRRK